MHRTIKILKESSIIDSVILIDSDAIGNYYILKIQARLINGWKLHIWEHLTPKIQRYAYHVSEGTQLVIRWDNAPHHRQVNTFPHHKHVKEDILASKEMSIENILEELEKIIQGESS